jgi:Protein of unknown function (DUF732)
MKVIVAAMAAGAAALAVAGAPVAHAAPNDPCEQYSHTPDGYIADMHRCGFASLKSDDTLLATGARTCGLMRSQNADGYGPSKVMNAVMNATGWDMDTAVNFVSITLADLCPELVTNEPIPTPSVPYPGVITTTPPYRVPPGYRDGD